MRKPDPRRLPKLALILAIAALTGSSVHAAALVNYTFNSTGAPLSEAPNVEGGTAVWNGYAGNIGFSAGSNAFARADRTSASFTSTQYLEFTITTDPGYFLDLDNLVFDLGGQNASTTTPYTVNSNIRTSADAFGSDISMTPGPVTTASHTIVGVATNYSTFTTDLSGSQYDNLSTITFRIYPSDDSSSTGNWFRVRNVTLNGEVSAVPEPSTVLFAVFGASALLVRRHRTPAPDLAIS